MGQPAGYPGREPPTGLSLVALGSGQKALVAGSVGMKDSALADAYVPGPPAADRGLELKLIPYTRTTWMRLLISLRCVGVGVGMRCRDHSWVWG